MILLKKVHETFNVFFINLVKRLFKSVRLTLQENVKEFSLALTKQN